MSGGLTLDAGALIALDRRDRRMLALLAGLDARRERVTLPATAFAQVVRDPATQVLLVRLARRPTTDLVELDRPGATAVGILLAATGTSDIVDAHVIVCARRAGQPIVTTDSVDLRRLDPKATLIEI